MVYQLYLRKFSVPAEFAKTMEELGVSPAGIQYMQAKGNFYTFLVKKLSLPAANILKQEMLSIGGEIALHQRTIIGDIPATDGLLMGTKKQILELCAKLRLQQFSLPQLAADVEEALTNLEQNKWQIALKKGSLQLGESPKIMGILNITPDSFSDGGLYNNIDSALAKAEQMIADGADIIDVGGESTRPGAEPVKAEEEIFRVLPVIKELAKNFPNIPISIDTYKSETARAALFAGASLINDISGLSFDPNMAKLAAQTGVPLIIGHNDPRQTKSDIMFDIIAWLRERVAEALAAGVKKEQLIIDPGIGFCKNTEENLVILNRLSELKIFGFPVLLGASRKRFIGEVLEKGVEERLFGTAAAVAWAASNGADIIRVHDVKEMTMLVKMTAAIKKGGLAK